MKRITETIIYEVYFDLWGFSMPWINAIANALHAFCDCSTDSCESYTCEANMSVRFQSTDINRVARAKNIYNQRAALATAQMSGNPEDIYYSS